MTPASESHPLDIWGKTKVEEFMKSVQGNFYPHDVSYFDGHFDLEVDVFGWQNFRIKMMCNQSQGYIGLIPLHDMYVPDFAKIRALLPTYEVDVVKKSYLRRNTAITSRAGLLYSDNVSSVCSFVKEEIDKIEQAAKQVDFEL